VAKYFTTISTAGVIPGPVAPSSAPAGAIADVPQLTAEPSGTDKIVLTLISPSDSDYSICEIHRATVGGQFSKLTELATGTYDDEDVTAEQVYYYVAVALNTDGKLPRLSRIAYARCTNWTAAKFSFTDATVDPTALSLESNYGRLIYRVCQTLDELDLFKAVIPFLEPPPQWQSPTCVVAPVSDDVKERRNAGLVKTYEVKLGIVLAGEDGSRKLLQALALRDAIIGTFEGTSNTWFKYTDLTGHQDTRLVRSPMGPEAVLPGGALFWSTGLTLQFDVWEPRGLNTG